MMSRHFALSSELTGGIAKILPHAKNQLSSSGSFFNQFVTEIYIYTYIHTYTHINRVLIVRTSALRACLRCAAGGHFVSAGGSLRSPGVTLVNYKGDNISKYVCSTVLIDITRKITKFVNFKIFDA